MNLVRDLKTAVKTVINTATDKRTYQAIAYVLKYGNRVNPNDPPPFKHNKWDN